MKIYTFFYYDSFEDFKNIKTLRSYRVESSRFDFALKSFSKFLAISDFDFIEFSYSYNVFNGFKTQVRSLSYEDVFYLKDFVYKHNSNPKGDIL